MATRLFSEAVRRVREIDGSGTMKNKIVWVVEPPALETVGEHGLGAPVLFEPDHPPRPMLADKETSLGVEGETI